MTPEKAFEILKKKIIEMGARTLDNGAVCLLQNVIGIPFPTHIELTEVGKSYTHEIFIGCEQGFATNHISVLYEHYEDWEWCWEALKRIGITEDIFNE